MPVWTLTPSREALKCSYIRHSQNTARRVAVVCQAWLRRRSPQQGCPLAAQPLWSAPYLSVPMPPALLGYALRRLRTGTESSRPISQNICFWLSFQCLSRTLWLWGRGLPAPRSCGDKFTPAKAGAGTSLPPRKRGQGLLRQGPIRAGPGLGAWDYRHL